MGSLKPLIDIILALPQNAVTEVPPKFGRTYPCFHYHIFLTEFQPYVNMVCVMPHGRLHFS